MKCKHLLLPFCRNTEETIQPVDSNKITLVLALHLSGFLVMKKVVSGPRILTSAYIAFQYRKHFDSNATFIQVTER